MIPGQITWKNEFTNEGMTTVTINHGNFIGDMLFTLYGGIFFNHCLFNSKNIRITIFSFVSIEPGAFEGLVKFYRLKVWGHTITFDVVRTSCEIHFSHSDLKCAFLNIRALIITWEDKYPLMSISIQIDQSSISGSQIDMSTTEQFALLFRIIDVELLVVMLKTNVRYHDSYLFVDIENSTWVNRHHGFMNLINVLSVRIVSSELGGMC